MVASGWNWVGRSRLLLAGTSHEAATEVLAVDVDARRVIRRQRFEFAFEPQNGGQKVSFRYDIELYDFGVEVDVQPPPEADTADLTELLSRAAGSSG